MATSRVGTKNQVGLMDKKETSVDRNAPRAAPSPRKAAEFVGEVKTELKRIQWTSKEELKVYTKIVVLATLALGIGIYGTDLLIRGILDGFAGFMRLITG